MTGSDEMIFHKALSFLQEIKNDDNVINFRGNMITHPQTNFITISRTIAITDIGRTTSIANDIASSGFATKELPVSSTSSQQQCQ